MYGPTELFYFGVDKVITDFPGLLQKDTPDKAAVTESTMPPDRSQFCWIDRSSCLRALGNINVQLFIDALVLAGSEKFLTTFPPLVETAMYKHPLIIKEAVNLLIANRGNVPQLCAQYSDPSLKEAWLDKYKRSMTIIKHHVVITADGDVEALDKDKAPVDTHDCIGLRLPEELYMYLSRGVVGTRVLNWLTRGEVIVGTPLAGADADTCRDFEKNRLGPLRKQAVCLLTEGLHRYYQRADFKSLFWFDKTLEEKFKPVDMNPSPRAVVSRWNVNKDIIHQVIRNFVLRWFVSDVSV